ncbi:MAG TPA: hypothetical protein VE619_10865 [Nitrososphaeraceae archaeon]|nr:hypothetical protein [Nitrososphaeraceae archaeon]
MVKGLRVCPICPNCGSKKFKVIDNTNVYTRNSSSNNGKSGYVVIVECLNCAKKMSI